MIGSEGKYAKAKIFTDTVEGESISQVMIFLNQPYVQGKGNADWNYSAPHGAGRLMSRSAAKGSFTVNAYKKETEGIVDSIGPTAQILRILKPIYNFKAGDEEQREAGIWV